MPDRGPPSGSRHCCQFTRPPRFLVVDDEPAVLRAIARVVGSARPSWQLRTVHSTRDALIELCNRRFDVLVTEIELAGRSGLELLDVIHHDFPHLACVVHSAQVETYAGHPSLLQAVTLLQKPCRPKNLIAAMTDALWNSVSAGEARASAAG